MPFSLDYYFAIIIIDDIHAIIFSPAIFTPPPLPAAMPDADAACRRR